MKSRCSGLLSTVSHYLSFTFPFVKKKGVSENTVPSKDKTCSFTTQDWAADVAEFEARIWEGFLSAADWTTETTFSRQIGSRWPFWPHFQHVCFCLVTMCSATSKQLGTELASSRLCWFSTHVLEIRREINYLAIGFKMNSQRPSSHANKLWILSPWPCACPCIKCGDSSMSHMNIW